MNHRLNVVAEWDDGETPIDPALVASVVKAVLGEMLVWSADLTVKVDCDGALTGTVVSTH